MTNSQKSDLLLKLEKTLNSIAPDGKFALAFSGGVDSSILLSVAVKMGMSVLAVTFNTNLTKKMVSINGSKEYAESLGAKHITLDVDVLSDPGVYGNSKLRCYYCKSAMFAALTEVANKNGFDVLCDGTNADDLKEYRPGLKAKDEYGILSPIALSGLSKSNLREIGRELGLPIASQPSTPCLLTRFSYGTKVTNEMLESVEAGEQLIKAAGFSDCRLRVHGRIARIEIPKRDFEKFLTLSEKLTKELKPLGFDYITLDIEGLRSGSMDV